MRTELKLAILLLLFFSCLGTSGCSQSYEATSSPKAVSIRKWAEVRDREGPTIALIAPPISRGMKHTHTERTIGVRGRAIDESGVSSVLVNGISADLSADGEFSTEMRLGMGENTLRVRAIDTKGNASEETFTIVREAQPGAVPPAARSTMARKGTDYALLFATDRYDYWPSLLNPVNDARTIAEDLKSSYGFQNAMSENPTQDTILLTLRKYAEKRYIDEDQLLILFAGHGQFDEVFKEGFVVARDTKLQDDAKTTYISHERLRAIIDNIPCKHILLVMDVCFSGTFERFVAIARGEDEYSDIGKEEFIARKLRHRTRLYLTSGGKEYVSDGRPGQHSPFTRRFLEALRSYGGNDGILTINEILNYVEKVEPEPRAGEFGSNEPGSDFIFIARWESR